MPEALVQFPVVPPLEKGQPGVVQDDEARVKDLP